MVALVLLAHITQGIHSTPLVEFIQGDDVCEVQHIDLLQLRCCSVFRGHHIQAHIAVVNDLCIALSDAGCFQDDEIVTGGFQHRNCITHILTQCQVGLAGSQRTHIDPWVVDAVHADTVAQ